MFVRSTSTIAGSFAITLACVALQGCGSGAPSAASKDARGIYTTATDCADSGKLSYEACAAAMEKAVAEHEAAAPKYASLRSCETTEGADRCERTEGDRYRPRLLAFLVIASKPPVASPLYAAPAKTKGFRTANKTVYLTTDETLAFSSHAITLAESGKTTKKTR